MPALLSISRFFHFVATLSLMGIFSFECLVVAPSGHACGTTDEALEAGRRRSRRWIWGILPILLLSGAGWLFAVAVEMSEMPPSAILRSGVMEVVLIQTHFGHNWLLRFSDAAILVLWLLWIEPAARVRSRGITAWRVGAILTGLLTASLAWSAHGVETPGASGDLHVAADALHLIAAGMWLGTLIPLALFLDSARSGGGGAWEGVSQFVTRRYSRIALISVAVLLGSGAVDTSFLVGSLRALVGTTYGRLLLVKIGLFCVMGTIGAVNFLRLGPRFRAAGPGFRQAIWDTAWRLQRNALIEASIGCAILAIVAELGTMPPAMSMAG